MSLFSGIISVAAAAPLEISFAPEAYRTLLMRTRQSEDFVFPAPSGDTPVSYRIEWGLPLAKEVSIFDLALDSSKPSNKFREFSDKIFVKDGSFLQIGQTQLPVTCVYVKGRDNRMSGLDSPLFPQILLEIYIVANDFACAGPFNKGFPGNGGKRELWETYLYYRIKDPTIMLPADARLRYRWNEFDVFLNDQGRAQ